MGKRMSDLEELVGHIEMLTFRIEELEYRMPTLRHCKKCGQKTLQQREGGLVMASDHIPIWTCADCSTSWQPAMVDKEVK